MKRELFDNVLAIPYNSGDIIDRSGYLSAVIGTTAEPGTTITVKAEHSDDGKAFIPVTDELVFPGSVTDGGEYQFTVPEAEESESEVATAADKAVNIDVDLVGLKPYVKFTITGGGSLAVVLGDSAVQPV